MRKELIKEKRYDNCNNTNNFINSKNIYVNEDVDITLTETESDLSE